MPFVKRPKTVSVKQWVMNFDRLIREVAQGRVIRVFPSRGGGAIVLPISKKQRHAIQHHPRRKAMLTNKPGKRW